MTELAENFSDKKKIPLRDHSEARDTKEVLADRRVLVVEDDILIAMDIECALKDNAAIPVGPVGHISRGIELARFEAIDAAVLDVDLEGEDVFPIAGILTERGIPFMFHTGHGERIELRTRYANAPVLSKPGKIEDLLDTVAELLTPVAC